MIPKKDTGVTSSITQSEINLSANQLGAAHRLFTLAVELFEAVCCGRKH